MGEKGGGLAGEGIMLIEQVEEVEGELPRWVAC